MWTNCLDLCHFCQDRGQQCFSQCTLSSRYLCFIVSKQRSRLSYIFSEDLLWWWWSDTIGISFAALLWSQIWREIKITKGNKVKERQRFNNQCESGPERDLIGEYEPEWAPVMRRIWVKLSAEQWDKYESSCRAMRQNELACLWSDEVNLSPFSKIWEKYESSCLRRNQTTMSPFAKRWDEYESS